MLNIDGGFTDKFKQAILSVLSTVFFLSFQHLFCFLADKILLLVSLAVCTHITSASRYAGSTRAKTPGGRYQALTPSYFWQTTDKETALNWGEMNSIHEIPKKPYQNLTAKQDTRKFINSTMF